MGPKSIIAIIGVIVIAVIFVLVVLVRGITSGGKNAPAPTEKIVKTVPAADIVADPLVYVGLNVTVDAPITDWVTKRAFTVNAGGNGVFGSTGQLLVISKKPFSLPKTTTDKNVVLGDSVNVRLKGRVVILSREQLASELDTNLDSDEFALDDNNINEWELGSVLLLDSVEKLQK